MRYGVFLLFLSTLLNAQELPVSESNVFIYNSSDYGKDLVNVVNPMKMDKNGAVWCQPYNADIFKIGNNDVTLPLGTGSREYGSLQTVLAANGCEYYCTSRNILVMKNKKLIRRINLVSLKEQTAQFLLTENKIYFVKFDAVTGHARALHCFDGESVRTVRNFDKKILSVLNFISGQKHYLFENERLNSTCYSIINNVLKAEKTYYAAKQILHIVNFKDLDNFTFFNSEKKGITIKGADKKIAHPDIPFRLVNDTIVSNIAENQKYIYSFVNDHFVPIGNSGAGDTFFSKLYSPESNSYYCGTNTSMLRLFPHIKKYPRLFYNNNSNSVFTLQQDNKGQIWAGSYQMALSVITNDNQIIQDKKNQIRFINGGTNYKDKILLLGESHGGLLLFDELTKHRQIADSVTAFFTYISKNKKLYLGTSMKGIWHTDINNLDSKKTINWRKINEKQGLDLENILTISEDRYGNIWYGSGRGIGMYDVKTSRCKTWKSETGKRAFAGTRALLLDSFNTLWIGARNGQLLFYNGKNATDYHLSNFIPIRHPLFETNKVITFIHQWNDYLVLGASDKVLLFNLKEWHKSKTVSVRYLNPMEINLNTDTEQNTILTDNRDESIWFSSSDMVYQWDIKKWLTLPTFKVIPTVIINKKKQQTTYASGQNIDFKPTENSFDIRISYQSLDNMPRFLNGVLTKKDEKPQFGPPDLQTQFQFKSLSPGDYVFYVRICQQDGSFNVFEYPITIRHFFWQQWWFWCLVSLIPIGFIIFYLQKRNEIEQQKKKLSQLNLANLSNQFRPHFMLNALNSIGSQMGDKPHAEKVISRLGESINILYNFTQKNDFAHAFENEWKLVENIIEIQRLLFIPELEVIVDGQQVIPKGTKIPVGLLQIPVENALLHGLRNKTDGNCSLSIRFQEVQTHYLIWIEDNGVGREKAAKINNFRKHGNGLRTVYEMIAIINRIQKNAIDFDISNLHQGHGTLVKISISKLIDYGKIKL